MRAEWVVCVTGRVKKRTAPNDKVPTGIVEVAADKVTVLNTVAKSLPFSISGAPEGDDDELREEVRLKHRVLDLRRPQMVRNLRLRAKTIRALREVLEDTYDFLEVETPILTRSTPEGARDYLVPSRLQPGACFALPQSPQLFKQMLMVAGADRYYQVARCFRDEDLRADRQPEFTQLDIEMSFTDMDGILSLGEDLMCAAFSKGADVELPRPFKRMTYAEAMSKYGSDKPDVRYGLEMAELADVVAGTEFKLFAGAIEAGGVVKAIAVPEGKRISNSRLKPKGDVFNEAIAGGAGGLAFARVGEDGVTLEGGKALCEGLQPVAEKLIARCGASAGDLLLFGAGDEGTVNKALDRVRQFVAKTLDMVPEGQHAVLWITEFPMFEFNEDENRLEALHHPFTAPNQSDVANGGDIKQARAIAYDLVYNGVEVGGGSLRIYRRDVQEKVFDAIGLSEEEAEEKFGYLMEAFQFGAPPHGGMAFGLDRLVMMLAGAKSIRDVIAFPKTATAQCLLTAAPGDVSDAQLEDLHIAKALKPEKAV
jgi:aspartyl-tRNA synthetase